MLLPFIITWGRHSLSASCMFVQHPVCRDENGDGNLISFHCAGARPHMHSHCTCAAVRRPERTSWY